MSTCLLVSRYIVISNWQGCYSTCLTIVSWRVWAATVPPVVFQCRLQKFEFLQWHSTVGLFQLSFSSGVPVYPASIRWVAQLYPNVHWVNQVAFQWHSSVHWTSQGKGTHSSMRYNVKSFVPPTQQTTHKYLTVRGNDFLRGAIRGENYTPMRRYDLAYLFAIQFSDCPL